LYVAPTLASYNSFAFSFLVMCNIKISFSTTRTFLNWTDVTENYLFSIINCSFCAVIILLRILSFHIL
jgi:hypothetical protein